MLTANESVSTDEKPSQTRADADAAKESRYYRAELDWLRFLAFLLVFVFHALPHEPEDYAIIGINETLAAFLIAPFVRAGGHGVDLFFVLSSFLISELLMRERTTTGTVHIKEFYLRRILRIWPLYFLFAVIVYPYDYSVTGHTFGYYTALLCFFANWYRIFTAPVLAPTAHLWTVSVEEQFYAVWPHIIRYASLRRFAAIMTGMLLFAIVSRTLYVFLRTPDQFTVMSNTLMRLDVFALGGLLAWYLRSNPFNPSRSQRNALLAAAALLYWLIGLDPDGGYVGIAPMWSYPAAGLASVLCLFTFLAAPPRLSLNRPLRALAYLGKISYGLYMWHWPAIWFTQQMANESLDADVLPFIKGVLAAGITFFLSVVSYELLEKPFLRLKRRFTFVASRPE